MASIDKLTNNYIPAGYNRQSFNLNAGTSNGTASVTENVDEIMQKKRLGVIECETCANRQYVDGSDDPGVSFKTPTKLDPNEAATQVYSHEMEHYTREASKAVEEDREVVSNNIQIFTSVCSECGKTYVSGGLTTTVTKGKDDNEPEGVMALFGTPKPNENGPNSVPALNKKIANQAYGLSFDEKG